MEPISAYSEFWVYYNDIKKDSEGNYRINRWNVNDGTNKTHDFRFSRPLKFRITTTRSLRVVTVNYHQIDILIVKLL